MLCADGPPTADATRVHLPLKAGEWVGLDFSRE